MSEWRLSIGNRFTGLVVCPDPKWPSMWRIHYGGRISDMVNLARAKDAAVSWVGGGKGIRWERRGTLAEGSSKPTATSAAPSPRGMLIVVKEYKRRGLFDAYFDGRWLCRSHAPLLSAARVLLAEGIPPETPIMMRHQGSETISLRSTVGGAAALVVESSRWGRPVPARHENQQARPRPDLADDESDEG